MRASRYADFKMTEIRSLNDIGVVVKSEGEENILRTIIFLLAVAGIVVSSLAWRIHYSTATEPCDINAHWDCGIVNHSRYSMIHGIPVAAIGVAGYLLIAILALFRQRRWVLVFALG